MSSNRVHVPTCVRSGTHPIVDELRTLLAQGDYPMLLRRSSELASRVRRSRDHALLAQLLGRLADEGPISAIVAIESLAHVEHPRADDRLIAMLAHGEPLVRRHATWRLLDRRPDERAIPALVGLLVIGGIDTMHAHRTLRHWSALIGPAIVRAVVARLAEEQTPAARARLVDLLGVIADDADPVLLHLALDEQEASAVRAAAIGAVGQRTSPEIDAALQLLATYDDMVGTDAAVALSARLRTPAPGSRDERNGLRIAQLVLAGRLDGQLSRGGRGDTGGVASLLVSLGEALARRDDVDHVVTIGRGTLTDAVLGPLSSSRIPLSYGMVAFGDDARPAASANEAWEHLPAIERGIRRVLRLAGPVDVVHLRMADAGTLAGANVAAELGIPVCFSVAPDPHNVVESLQRRGELDAESFLRLDAETHVWFRARLIERIARNADQLALFPRSKPIEFLERLGIDGEQRDQCSAVVAEGIDISLIDRAIAAGASSSRVHAADVLDELTASIPPSRRGLPLVLTVGRLNPVKGMDRVVAAWAADPDLHDMCNLVIVGGDLAAPSATEAAVVQSIDRLVPSTDSRRHGLVMLGGHAHADIAKLLVATASGRTGDWAPGGVYVDGALKEEFGLAVLEAMAAGLPVVAPSTGGPSTYVDDGDTGVLVDPDADLGAAIRAAFGLVARAGRAKRARAMVEERYSIDTMAAQLVELYRPSMAMR